MNLPIGKGVELLLDVLLNNFGPFFEIVSNLVEQFMTGFTNLLLVAPPLVVILALTGLALLIADKKVAFFSFIGLFVVFGMGLWVATIRTFVLVFVAAVIALALGIPTGILINKSQLLNRIITPILDFMQTMPPFVYLIPATMFFGIGNVPGVMATVIFAMPPAIRLTDLGLKQVPDELEEVGFAFGSTPWQMLFKVRLPLALPSIMAGINQCIMLSLSMVVIASMIGAKGLGAEVLNGIQRMQIGVGFEAGLGVVILAIILDRITKGLNQVNAEQ
ncbi:ABC transporter permease [Acetohalobium arabaticum]|uniref:Binding-protein-dependent transport systems inner membrane component n=1 Tax=Acetohalobium arabaticum (strain ATCC 49924 / DSM 5501 / Z-7288) TaxID=574087 RepID=D9QUS2_ACEAZ|nr:proline/glycine betaine ABC transporter permease [Acetohalobium arabaticum]ADL11981.1 binding-protein-dependent transport systems inner membrane component [Acetohalobium arabaticum DSM 5501]